MFFKTLPTHLWLFGLLRMVDICFYFECKGNGFWAGMQSSFWFIFVLLGGDAAIIRENSCYKRL